MKKPVCSVRDYKNHYKGGRIRVIMAKEWVGKCNSCNKWRTNFDTYNKATVRDEKGFLSWIRKGVYLFVNSRSTQVLCLSLPSLWWIRNAPQAFATTYSPGERRDTLNSNKKSSNNWHNEQMQILYGKDYR